MNRKKILIVSASFYPQISPRSFRTTELARELARQGHEVVVCIPDNGFDYSNYIQDSNLTFKNMGIRRFRHIELKGNSLELFLRRGIRRILRMFFDFPAIELMFKVANCLKHEKGYDMLISIAVPFPIHWGVAKARTKDHQIARLWVADCGDPYMGCETDSFKKPFYFKYIEKWFSKKSDFITVPFEALRPKFYPEFHEKIVVIPQGFRVQDIRLCTIVNNQIPTFAYSGSIIPGIRDFDAFFELLKGIDREFKFYVYTKEFDYFNKFMPYFQDRLEIHEYLPREQLLFELSKCDFLINVDTIYDCQSINTAFPSKLIDYAFTKRPILSICSNLIEKNTVLEFFAGNYVNRRMIDCEKYDIETVSRSFLELIK